MSTFPKTKRDITITNPDTSSTVYLKGLDSNIEIYRDGHGIPHVKAKTTHDAFFGQGFATAQDRLWHMDHDRFHAYGRWSEYVGQAAVPKDIQMRRFQLRHSVENDFPALDTETTNMLNAYTNGVNAFIQNTETLPVEYTLVKSRPEPWQPWDCLAVFKFRHILMGVFESKLWRAHLVNELGAQKTAQIIPGYQFENLLIVPSSTNSHDLDPPPLNFLTDGVEAISHLCNIDDGSNNWAISGNTTASGKPLLAGDPHRAIDTPNVYYQNHIACPEFDVIGLSFPGLPGFPHFGHNTNVAWCVTHAQADYQDLYIEKFKKGSPNLYEFKKQWKHADIRREVINVKGGKQIKLDITITHHGPIIVGDPSSEYAVAFKYTATTGLNQGFQCLPKMLMATSANEIEESMKDWVDPSNNFVFADIHGDIGYLNRGRLPIRSMSNAWLPVPGWTGQHEWHGFVPFEELARSRNPSNEYIVTANNKIVSSDYPHYIGLHFSPDHRARRIIARLNKISKATVSDMASIHKENISIPGKIYADLLYQIQPIDQNSLEAQKRLEGWDGAMDKNLVPPTIYSAFRLHLNRKLLQHILGPVAEKALSKTGRGAPFHMRQLEAIFPNMAKENETSVLPPGEDWKSLMAKALADAVNYLKKRLGNDMDSWTWGSVHFTRPKHPLSDLFPEMATLLDPPSIPMSGDGDTPQAASYAASQPFIVTGSSVARYVFDTSSWDNSRWIVPLGSSGNPGSPHYADQAPIWGDLKLIPMLFDWNLISKVAESHQNLRNENEVGI